MFDIEKEYVNLGLKKEEFEKIKSFLKRTPNMLELNIYSVMWSEHCSYKSSKPLLKNFKTTGTYVLQGPGENAGILDIGNEQALVFKMESHNHPSAVEPYHGAATGLGGVVRDIFAMGARPVCNLNSLRFGKLEDSKHQKFLFKNVVKGMADYGNNLGTPTIGGETYFDKTYEENCLVNAMSVGLVHKDKIIKAKASGAGNKLVLIGSDTARDGVHGATFASDEFNEDGGAIKSTVPIGDPVLEKRVMEVCLELIEKNLILGLQDMGAAGITSSSVEMVSKGDAGVDIDISKVPLKEADMEPYEIMISETQERMLALIRPSQFAEIKEICERQKINCEIIGTITDNKLYRIFNGSKLLGEIPVKSLTDEAPVYYHKFEEPAYFKDMSKIILQSKDYELIEQRYTPNEIFEKVITSPNICSKKWVWDQFDNTEHAKQIGRPGQDASIIKIKNTKKAIAFSSDGNGRYCYLDPMKGAIIAVAESARNLVCSGALPIGLTDCLNFGNPEKPDIFWQFKNAINGIIKGCEVLDIPVISGNVSFYNESLGKAIHPTPVIATAGLLEDERKIIDTAFKDEGDEIILIGRQYKTSATNDNMGGSEFQEIFFDRIAGLCPDIDIDFEKKVQQTCLTLINKGLVRSAHDISIGGLAVTIAESCIYGNIGAEIKVELLENNFIKTLYSEPQSQILISCLPENSDLIKKYCLDKNIPFEKIGRVSGRVLNINSKIEFKVEKITELYDKSMERIMAH